MTRKVRNRADFFTAETAEKIQQMIDEWHVSVSAPIIYMHHRQKWYFIKLYRCVNTWGGGNKDAETAIQVAKKYGFEAVIENKDVIVRIPYEK